MMTDSEPNNNGHFKLFICSLRLLVQVNYRALYVATKPVK